MNNDYLLLETMANFLKQGYLFDEILLICKEVYKSPKITQIETLLNNGYAFDEALIKCEFDRVFSEYFSFFKNKNNLSNAILQSLEICRTRDQTINQLKKELTYPLLLIIFLLFFSFFIVYALLPSVMQLFTEFSIKPSLVTTIMFTLFKIIPIFIIIIIISFITIISIISYAIKKQYFQLIDFFVTKTPLFKIIIQKYYSIKFALYYNELLVSGYDSTDIIIMLYQQIEDSDIKMLVFEIYQKILNGELLETIIAEFDYFEPLFISCFRLLLQDNRSEKSLNDYLSISLNNLQQKIRTVIKFVVPIVYCFTAGFVILVYVSIIIPMMSVVSNL